MYTFHTTGKKCSHVRIFICDLTLHQPVTISVSVLSLRYPDTRVVSDTNI